MNAFDILLFACILLFATCLILMYELKKAKTIIKNHGIWLDDRESLRLSFNKSVEANNQLKTLLKFKDETPEDCKQGPWCGACQFGKLMMVYSDYGYSEPYYYCTKAQCCDYWTERKTSE